MDFNTLVLIGIGVLVILIVADLLLAGGAMTMGTMHGMSMVASHPVGLGALLVLLSILGVLVYAVFFR
jgi:hypothetical protein